jgi:hypothetical protein
MQIIINTIEGTFIVPTERQADLIYWLKHNATKVDLNTVGEQCSQPYVNSSQPYQNYSGKRLLNEEFTGN